MAKTIIITGASSGIGNALAIHLASLEHKVIAVGRNNESLQKLQTLYPENIIPVVADITKQDDRIKIKNAIREGMTGILLVHNAGIALPGLLSEISEEQWDKHYTTNAKAPIFLTQLLLPYLRNGGRVLNVSTGLAHKTLLGMGVYGISKTCLYMWKEYCNQEFNKDGIIFGSAMPGVVDTPIQHNLRSYNVSTFPTVQLFQGFFQRGELLNAKTVAKFLTWLLIDVEDKKFMKGDWDIYDNSHHHEWAMPEEIKQREQKKIEDVNKAEEINQYKLV